MRKLCSEWFNRHASNIKELYMLNISDVFLLLEDHLLIVTEYLRVGDFWHKLKKVETFSQNRKNFITE